MEGTAQGNVDFMLAVADNRFVTGRVTPRADLVRGFCLPILPTLVPPCSRSVSLIILNGNSILCDNFVAMKRVLLLAAILAAVAGNLSSSPDQSSPAHKQEVAQQSPANPSPVTVVIENAQRSEPTQAPKPEPPKGYASPEGALVIVGIVTCLVIGWQSWETRKSAEATDKSAKLQRAGMNQWVEVENWQGGKDIWRPDDDDAPHHLMFDFVIVNPTNYPMTLRTIRWKIGEQEGTLPLNFTFPPKGRHPTITSYDLTDEEFLNYGDAGKPLELSVSGSIDFDDVLRNPQTQLFWVAFHCRFTDGIIIVKPYKTSSWVQHSKAWKKPEA